MKLRHLLFALALSAAACKTTEEAAPTDSGTPPRDVTDASADANADAAKDAAADASNDVAPDVSNDVVADAPADVTADAPADVTADAATDVSADVTADAAADVTADAAADGSCAPGDGGCISCPTTSAEIINRCTTASCARFERTRLTRLLADGGLPPLP